VIGLILKIMLTQISVRNLGCFDDQIYKVDFTEETLLAGPNNSGKSMLLAAMNLARFWVVTGSLNWDTEFYLLNSYEASVNAHDSRKVIDISFTLKDATQEYAFDFTFSPDRVRKAIALTPQNEALNPRDPRLIDLVQKIWCLRPNRSLVPYRASVQRTEGPIQPLRPSGSNVINFLLERWTDRDKKWSMAESWLRKIDPDMSELKTPIRGNEVFLETLFGDTDVNVSLQGSGFQSAAAIVSAVVFSPEGSTVIIEEPEAFLHPSSQEVIVDMINDAVNNHNKQVIFSTHSCNILLPIWHDIGQPSHRRSEEHIPTDPKKFSMWVFEKISGNASIKPYPLNEKIWKNFSDDFKIIWG
jgi:predicted ATPase